MAAPVAGDWGRPVPEQWQDGDDALPATQISWFDALAFCNALSLISGRRPFYRQAGGHWSPDPDPAARTGYRLPTEAEWEYACRGGTDSIWFWGDDPGRADAHAWYRNNTRNRKQAVATKLPNPFGLHDLAGNCWEWCWDWYASEWPEASADPTGPATGTARVLRGGSFVNLPEGLRSAARFRIAPEGRGRDAGFRCARSAAPGPR
jgi:formylglycine-generating enzyme required for sulfatase activity